MIKKYVCIPRSLLVINVCNEGKTLCSPCTSVTHGCEENIMSRGINWAGRRGGGEGREISKWCGCLEWQTPRGGKFRILNKTFDFFRSKKNFQLSK